MNKNTLISLILIFPLFFSCFFYAQPADSASYIGPGLVINDNNSNLPVKGVGGGTFTKVLFTFRAPKSGNLTKFRTYLKGDTGYSEGTGGKIEAKIWPADSSTPARPIRTSTPLSSGYVQLNFINGVSSQLADRFPLFSLTANAPLVSGQLYFLELSNIDPAPASNWVSANALCAIDEHVTAVRHTPASDWAMIWEWATAGSSTFYDVSTVHYPGTVTGSLYYFPSAEYGYSDGEWFGFVRLEPGNFAYSTDYRYIVDSSNPVRERFNIPANMTITGVEIHASAQVAGSLSVIFKKNNATVATTTINQPTANFSTSGPNSNGVYTWYSLDLPAGQSFTVVPRDTLDIEMTTVGSSIWRMSADRTGVDSNLGLSNAATYADSSAQKWNGSAWKNTVYYSQVCESCPFATSHFRVILKTVSTDTIPPSAPKGLRVR